MTSLDGINGRSIQTLLRGDNDSKQSDEIQANSHLSSIEMISSTIFVSNPGSLWVDSIAKKCKFDLTIDYN